MKLINLSLALLFNGALAADCLGSRKTNGIHDKHQQAYWEAREKMCSNSDCALQQPCTTYASRSQGTFVPLVMDIELKRKNTGSKPGFKDCWDATENIIQQCVKNGYLSGIWEANGQLYQLSGRYQV